MLFAMDGFTKELFVIPIKKKTTREVADAFEKVIKQARKPPYFAFTDMGKEFIGSSFQALMKKHNITHYVSRTKRKSFMCERVIRTIKTLLAKYFTHERTKHWLDIIPKIVSAYNNTPHSSHGFKPKEIKPRHVDEIISKLYSKLAKIPISPPKYLIGDKVRIAKNRLTFQKGYDKSFTDQVFRVSSYVPGSVPVTSYKLETLDGEPISSSFVEQELGYADQDQDK